MRLPLRPVTMLPQVDCARVLTLAGQEHNLQDLYRRMRKLSWRFRAELVVQTAQRDKEGGLAGVWRAHVRAWRAGYAAGCSHMLVLEDDVSFDKHEISFAGLRHAANFLHNGEPYDLLLLGWCSPPELPSRFAMPIRSSACTYTVSRRWRQMHAYVISAAAMHHWRHLKWSVSSHTKHRGLDAYLAEHLANSSRVVVTRPMLAFQSYHNSSNAWWPGADGYAAQQFLLGVLSSPEIMHAWEEGPFTPFVEKQQCTS